MFIFYIILVCTVVFITVLKIAAMLFSEKLSLSREEITSYECGFEFKSRARLPFSFRYYLLTLVFLLFDLELVFLVFLPMSVFYRFSIRFFLVIFFFIIILLLGLAYEWLDGSLEWVI